MCLGYFFLQPIGSGSRRQESQQLQEHLASAQRRLSMWEESWQQAKRACEAWRKEVESANRRINELEEERKAAVMAKEEVGCLFSFAVVWYLSLSPKFFLCFVWFVLQVEEKLKAHSAGASYQKDSCCGVHTIDPNTDLNELPLSNLWRIYNQLQHDTERIGKVTNWLVMLVGVIVIHKQLGFGVFWFCTSLLLNRCYAAVCKLTRTCSKLWI